MKIGRRLGCHQMPARSFFWQGYQFPLCARCTGVLAGNMIAVMSAFFYLPHVLVFVACCAIMFCDWLLQRLNVIQSTNPRRFVTGILGGYGLMSLMYITVIVWIIQFFNS